MFSNPFGFFGGTDVLTTTVGFTLSDSIYESESYSVTTQATTPQGMYIKPDDSKLYVIDADSDTVYQYTITDINNISTGISYDSKSYDFSTQENNPGDVFFSSDGTKMYLVGPQNATVYQYTLSTAWDVSTASYASKSKDVSTEETNPRLLYFSPDGTKMYVAGSTNDEIYQYTLSTAWDVSTASYDSTTFSTDNNPVGMSFNSNGSKIFVIGSTANTVKEYSLATAYDVGSTSVLLNSLDASSEDASMTGLAFKNSGTKLYLIGFDNDSIYQYTSGYEIIDPWNVSTAVYQTGKSFDVSTQDGTPEEIFFKPDGTKMYVVGNSNDTIYQYTLSTAWDVSTASYDTKSFDVSSEDATPTGLYIKSDGTKFYVVGDGANYVSQYSMSTAWDISTGSYDSKNYDVSTELGNPYGVDFKTDGSKMYVVGEAGDAVYQYSLSTDWDVSTASYDSKSYSVNTYENAPNSVRFKPDGTEFYVNGTSGSLRVQQFSMSTAWDVSTASYTESGPDMVSQGATFTGLAFQPDGTKMYCLSQSTDTVFQYIL